MDEDYQCGHEMCKCAVGEDEDFCSEHCEDADDQDMVEIKCDCGHNACE